MDFLQEVSLITFGGEQESSLSKSETIIIFLLFPRRLFSALLLLLFSFICCCVVSPARPVLASFSPQVLLTSDLVNSSPCI